MVKTPSLACDPGTGSDAPRFLGVTSSNCRAHVTEMLRKRLIHTPDRDGSEANGQMALLNVNAAETDAGCNPVRDTSLEDALKALPSGHPVTLMIHGYRFSPDEPERNPHRHILSLSPRNDCWKAVSWPRHLHLDRRGTGLGIGFGWRATGTLPEVAARARRVGTCLSRLISTVKDLRPDAPVQIIAHSLGARVALKGLEEAPDAAVQRMILMSGAEYRERALRALESPGAAACTVLNVTSSANTPFDILFRMAVAPDRITDLPLSAGLSRHPRCVDLRIDDQTTIASLHRLGHRIRPPAARVCHWSGYMRPGLFAVYRRLFNPADCSFPSVLRNALLAQEPEARSRLPRPTFSALRARTGGNPYRTRASSGF